jgi:hypothetical protein
VIATVEAVAFVRLLSSGRTKPALCICERANGSRVDVIVKQAAGCDAGIAGLSREAIAACLAADLGLPVCEPLWVKVPSGLIAETTPSITPTIAFGSRYAGPQYGTWISGTKLDGSLASQIMFFDAVIQNFDRRVGNPNLLVRGDDVRIIDHEAAFIYGRDRVIGWIPPWQLGGMQAVVNPSGHILRSLLSVDSIDEVRIKAAWSKIDEGKLREYRQALPPEFRENTTTMEQVERALTLVREACQRIDECLAEFRRVLQ